MNTQSNNVIPFDDLGLLYERTLEIQEIIRLAFRENRLDIVDDMIDELADIDDRLEYKGYLC